jgi:spore coat protein CotH
MRKLILIASLIIYNLNLSAQNLYDINSITTVDLVFFDSNWDALMDANYGTDNRILATATINGVVFDSVGVKYKGNSSYNASQAKNPFTVKLDYIKGNQDYDGYTLLKFSNVFKDPSFVREVMSYEMMRQYTTASQANFANVTMQGNLIGLFTSVQAVNDEFTEENYYSKNLPLFKGEFGTTPAGCTNQGPNKKTWDYYSGQDSSCYAYQFEIESSYGWNDVTAFLDTFNNYQSNMENVLYVDRHLWTMAYQNLTVNLDAAHNMGHNYYIYKDATKRFNNIIWDLNENFGVFAMIIGGTPGPPLNTTSLQQFDPYFQSTNVDMPVMKKVMDIPRYRKMYTAHMKTILNENFLNGDYVTRANQLQAIIDNDVQSDPNKFFTYANFQSNITSTVGGAIGIQQLMDARVTYINSLTDFQYTQPTITNITNSPTVPTAYDTVNFTCDIINTNYAYLGYRYSVADKFEKVEMFDDGAHNDGASGDGTFGAQIILQASDLEYYIYSENNDIGIFSPERAEYEFYTLAVSGDVVINELSASNGNIQADQDGEYDDWIELYNNTSSPIVLDGYHLSDASNDITKWTFPNGTSINANSYLIIWADKDTLQTGLHTNFKLSASGEALYFSDPSGALLDETTFTTQTTNITWGRYPNGTGSFTTMVPTYSAINSNSPLSIDNLAIKEINDLNIYPNPTSENVTLEFKNSETQTIYIFNIVGELVYQTVLNDKSIQLNVSDWSKGIYVIKTKDTVKKLIIK